MQENARSTKLLALIKRISVNWKDESRLSDRLATEPIKHLGQPEEIAEIAVMLASDKASYLTGQVITVDGGATLA